MGAKISKIEKIDRKGKGKAEDIDDNVSRSVQGSAHSNFISLTAMMSDSDTITENNKHACMNEKVYKYVHVPATNFDYYGRDPTGGGCW